jgi:hypothetical protein
VGVTGRHAGDAYSSMAPIPTSGISGVLVSPFISLTCNSYLPDHSWYDYKVVVFLVIVTVEKICINMIRLKPV